MFFGCNCFAVEVPQLTVSLALDIEKWVQFECIQLEIEHPPVPEPLAMEV